MLRVPDSHGDYETADVEPTAHGLLYHPTLGAWVTLNHRVREIDGESRFEQYARQRGTPTADRVNKIRCDLVAARGCRSILDVGIGSGEFIDHWVATPGHKATGFDMNPVAEAWLLAAGRFTDPYRTPIRADAVTLWDSLDHMTDPERLLDRVPAGSHLFLSVPTFGDAAAVRASPHYLPGDRLTYFRPWGPLAYLERFGFDCLEMANSSDTVTAYAFRRTTPSRWW